MVSLYLVKVHVDGQVSIDDLYCDELRSLHDVVARLQAVEDALRKLECTPLGRLPAFRREAGKVRARMAQLSTTAARYPLELVERIERDAKAGMRGALLMLPRAQGLS